MVLEYLQSYYFLFLMILPRIYASFSVITFMSKGILPGTFIRNGIIFSMSLFLFPVVENNFNLYQKLASTQILVLLIKEALVGFLIGFTVNIPFWAVTGVGHAVDNQRGATIMETLNVFSEDQGSPMANFFIQTSVTLFLITGGFIIFFRGLSLSYAAWPVYSFYPNFEKPMLDYFIAQFQWMMDLMLMLGGPLLIALFLSEMGLALISRFAPQLNVFILSMSVKSAVAIAFLVFYFAVITTKFKDLTLVMDSKIQTMMRLLQ